MEFPGARPGSRRGDHGWRLQRAGRAVPPELREELRSRLARLPARNADKDSPYLALIERIDRETRTELPRSGSLPSWIELLREVRRETPASEEEPQAPWQRYQVELEQVDVDVEAATEQGEQALELARRFKQAEDTSIGNALSLVRELVRSDRDGQATRKLREVLSMPFLDGGADVMASAIEELDRRWRDNVAEPYSGPLDSRQLSALYRPDGGDLAKFMEKEGGSNFYADGRALPVIGDAGLRFGDGFLGWMQHAERMQRSLYPGPGEVPRISVRLEGVPSRVIGGSGLFVTRRDLRVACADDVETFVYREGSGSHSFAWSPHCQEVSLRIWARQGGIERELMPRKEWSGPLAFPQWLQRAQRLSGNTLRWQLDYDGAELVVDSRLRSGYSLLEIGHRPPPNSRRN